MNKDFDDKGREARQGGIIKDLLDRLNQLGFYKQEPPKSLGREWLEQKFIPLTESYRNQPLSDIIATVTEHIAEQITHTIKISGVRNVLITGGGAYNDFLICLIRKKCHAEIILPDNNVIDYKEALIFAFLGVLRMRNENNCLKSVTGARADNCGGIVYLQ
jgi:anhydro-N-acetylmuramic acid kinase